LLKIDLKVGESVRIGGAIITLESKSGSISRLSIEAPKDVPIERVQKGTPASIAKNGLGVMVA